MIKWLSPLWLAWLLTTPAQAAPASSPAAQAPTASAPAKAAVSAVVEPGPQERIIRIGFSGPLSGASEDFGKSLVNAAELAVLDANRQHIHINGQRVHFRLVRRNDRNDVNTAIDVARQLVDSGVAGVVGTLYSTTTLATLGIYSAAGIPLVSPAASLSSLGSAADTFFRVIGRDDEVAAYIGDHVVRNMNLTRFALVDNGNPFGQELVQAFSNQVTVMGATIAAHDVIDFTTDLRALVQRLKADGVQAIFFGGYVEHANRLARAIHAEGSNIRLIMASNGAVGPAYLASAGLAAEGTLTAEPAAPVSRMPGWRRFAEQYQRRFESEMYAFTPFAYDAVQVLVAAIRLADSDDPRRVTDALRKIRFQGLTGQISFDDKGNQRHPVYTLFEVRGQRWVPVKVLGQVRQQVVPASRRGPGLAEAPSLAEILAGGDASVAVD